MDATTPASTYIEAACGKITQWEESIPWMYLDSPGLVTVGIGNMLPNLNAALALPFQSPHGGPASHDEIAADFGRVVSMERDHLATYYVAANSVRLLQADIEAMLFTTVAGIDHTLAKQFPHWGDWPVGAKLATIDMLYNLGAARFDREYPHLIRALDAEDWPTAAQQSGRDIDNAGFAARNYWTRCSFLDAVTEAKATGAIREAASVG